MSSTAPANKTESGGMRSDAVSLEVPVRVHGSRVTEVVRDTTPHTEPFEEETATMIVFPQGAVLRMATAVNAGQMVVVTNLKSGQDAICRVVKVRSYAANQSYVEVEFTHRQVGYWGVQFAADADAAKKPAPAEFPGPSRLEKAAAELSRNSAPTAASTPTPSAASRVTPIAKTPAPSAFTSIGTQEEVQSAAAPTSSSRAAGSSESASSAYGNSVVEIDRKARATESARKSETVVAMPSASHADEAEPEVQGGDAFPSPAENTQEESAAPAFGRLTAGGGTRAASREMFGAQFESEPADGAIAGPKKNLLLLGATAATVVLVGLAYFFFFHHAAPTTAPVAAPVASVAAPVSGMDTAPSAAASAATAANSAPANRAAGAAAASSSHPAAVRDAATASAKPESNAPDNTQSAPAPAAVERHSNGAMPSLFGALNAHPVAPHSQADAPDSAPEVDANALAGPVATGLPAISTNSNIPAPPKHVETPPRLVSSVAPTYPAMARQMRVEGTVVIDATIEANGTVGAMKVVSGPELLRASALSALRQWKYRPALSDGQAVASQTSVTLSFHSQQ